jgi:large subunit ribosomal protein L9
MKIILLEKIHNLGNLGDTVDVKPGYGRNYLIPQGKAVPANEENIAKFEARRAELEKAAAEQVAAAKKRAEPLKDLAITIACRALEEGKLFGSVGIREIVEVLEGKGIKVEKKEVILPEGPFHEVGEYEIVIRLHGDVEEKIKVKVEVEK